MDGCILGFHDFRVSRIGYYLKQSVGSGVTSLRGLGHDMSPEHAGWKAIHESGYLCRDSLPDLDQPGSATNPVVFERAQTSRDNWCHVSSCALHMPLGTSLHDGSCLCLTTADMLISRAGRVNLSFPPVRCHRNKGLNRETAICS